MRYQTWAAAILRSLDRLTHQPVIWVMLLTFCAFCALLGIFSALVLHQTALSQFIASGQSQIPAPTTPAVFGLSGQATCRNLSPPTPSPWLTVAHQDAQKYQLDALAFEWQIWQESKFNPNAVSAANAIGIAQFEPSTAASLGIDPRDPAQALDAAARLDQEHLSQWAARSEQLAAHYGGHSAHYAYAFILAAYNAGAGAVENAWDETYNSDDTDRWPTSPWDWLEDLSHETQHYVPAILGCL